MNIQYVVAECRPNTEEDGYADIVIDDDTYIFKSVDPAEDMRAAMLIAIDIEQSNPSNKVIVLHHQSVLMLCQGLDGKTIG